MRKKITLTTMVAFYCLWASAATFTSLQTGNWNSKTTWVENEIPTATDEVYINPGHTVTITGSSYTHNGDIVIYDGGTLIADVGNSSTGFIFDGGVFHVFGTLTVPGSPEKDLSITGNSLFWGHPSAIIYVSDDWEVSGNSETIVDGICVEVDDDFQINGSSTTVCGNGGVSIGNNSGSNTFNLQNGATANQICLSTTVYRGVGGNCTTIVQKGTGNDDPNAFDDLSATTIDAPITIDVLDLSTPDNDPSGQELKITAVGLSYLNNGMTAQGGTVSINDNGTPGIFNDDYVDYTPPAGFIGTDKFEYVITDQNGAYTHAEVTVEINAPVPVELVQFGARENACEVHLEWATASEINSSYFEVQKSSDGQHFKTIARENSIGFSTQYTIYEFADQLPEAENYYRLKQVDEDGTFTFSDVIYVKSNCIESGDNIGIVTLFPNPVLHQEVKLRFNALAKEKVAFSLSDLYGKIIHQEEISIDAGMNHIPIDVSNLQAGTYVVVVGKKVSRFIKTIE